MSVPKDVSHFALKMEVTCCCADTRCQREGRPADPFKDRSVHIRKCPCRKCRNRSSRSNGLTAQTAIAQLLGLPLQIKPGNEETLRTLLRFESKEGEQCKQVFAFYETCAEQSSSVRSIGDPRPFIAAATYGSRKLAVFDITELPEIVARMGAYYGYWGS